MNRGFSLVELSIVLVILGLLTGGILAGQSLIRAAELRSVSTEYSRYVAAAQTFRDKYFALPGDFRDATRFWGLQVAGSGCVSNSGLTTPASPGACDGNGNGALNSSAASEANELFQFWRQLALAGLLEGTYSGIAGSGAGEHCVFATNCPRSKLNNAGWGVRGFTTYFGGNTLDWAGDYGNTLEFGGQTTSYPSGPALKPEEAWNIDTKMDDGKPGTGKVFGYSHADCALASGFADFGADYNLASNSILCRMHFVRAF